MEEWGSVGGGIRRGRTGSSERYLGVLAYLPVKKTPMRDR